MSRISRVRLSASSRDLELCTDANGDVCEVGRDQILGLQLGTHRADGVDRPPTVHEWEQPLGLEPDAARPGAPGAVDAEGGIGENAVEIEQDRGSEQRHGAESSGAGPLATRSSAAAPRSSRATP